MDVMDLPMTTSRDLSFKMSSIARWPAHLSPGVVGVNDGPSVYVSSSS